MTTNLFKKIFTDLESVASKVENFLREVEGDAPAIEKVVATSLLVVGPLLQTVVTAEAGAPAGALVGSVISTVQQKLAAASQLVGSAGTSGSVITLLESASSDLTDTDFLAGVKSTAGQATVSKVLLEVETLIEGLSSLMPQAPAAVAAPAPAPAPAATPTPITVAASVAASVGVAAAEAASNPGLHTLTPA
jgi:hypothetical protein